MGFEIAALLGIGVVCSIIANVPVLVRGNREGVSRSNRRLLALMGAQTLLYAGYGLLLAYLQRDQRVASVAQAALLGGALALIPVLIGYRRTRAELIHSGAIGLSIVACSVAAFLLAPMVRGH